MSKPVLLLLGAGPILGKNVADTFLSRGWRVALVSRSKNELHDDDTLYLRADLSEPSSVAPVFEKSSSHVGPSYRGSIQRCVICGISAD